MSTITITTIIIITTIITNIIITTTIVIAGDSSWSSPNPEIRMWDYFISGIFYLRKNHHMFHKSIQGT